MRHSVRARRRQRRAVVALASAVAALLGVASSAGAANVTSSWISPNDGDWSEPSYWSSGVPDNGTQTFAAVIAAVGSPYTVTLSYNCTINGLTLNSGDATLRHTAGTLSVLSSPINLAAGTFQLAGGVINGGTISGSGGAKLVMTASGGTLSGVAVDADLELTDDARPAVSNGLVLNGTATLGAYRQAVLFSGTQTLGGSGTVFFGDARYQALLPNQDGMTLTIGPGITIRGGNSTNDTYGGAVIGQNGYLGGGSNASIINRGTISADATGKYLQINPTGTFTNTGTLQAINGGVLSLWGNWSSSGTININGGSFQAGASTTGTNSGRISYSSGSLSVGTLQLIAGGNVILSSGADKTLRVTAISIETASGSRIDLADNKAIVDYTGTSPIDSIYQLVKSGSTGGWTGNGITSSSAAVDATKAIGYGENSVLQLGSFGGYGVDSTCVLLKFTWRGDANLDGQVDITDLGKLATAWQTAESWVNGDFNYDGFVDISDLGILATNWQLGVGSPMGPSLNEALASVGFSGTNVPEPASAVLATVAIAFVPRWRRRQRR